MSEILAFLLFAAPLSYALAGFARFGLGRAAAARNIATSQGAAFVGFAASIALIALLWSGGPRTVMAFADTPWALGLRLDVISASMAGLIGFIGVIVVRFAARYLEGDPRHGVFMRRMSRALAAVSLLVVSGSLAVLAVAWIATSIALNDLLVFRGARPEARAAAAKKFLIARLGDACLLGAFAALYAVFRTADIAAIAHLARADAPEHVTLAAVLLAAAAFLKSAQFPFQGWLIEVVEAPTPVSALLHAGLVNAGGFLLIRFGDVMVLDAGAMHLVLAVGAATAVIGSLALLAQPTVKVGLAWSTVAQMGLMLMQCGFGAFSAALVHIIAHSAYKAHAFLSAGGAVEVVTGLQAAPVDRRLRSVDRVAVRMTTTITVLIVAAAAFALGSTVVHKPALLFLGPVLAMGLAQWVQAGWAFGARLADMAKLVGGVAFVAALYVLIQEGAHILIGGAVPEAIPLNPVSIVIAGLTLLTLAAILLMQSYPVNPRFLDPLRIAAKHGFYVDVWFDRKFGVARRDGRRQEKGLI